MRGNHLLIQIIDMAFCVFLSVMNNSREQIYLKRKELCNLQSLAETLTLIASLTRLCVQRNHRSNHLYDYLYDDDYFSAHVRVYIHMSA